MQHEPVCLPLTLAMTMLQLCILCRACGSCAYIVSTLCFKLIYYKLLQGFNVIVHLALVFHVLPIYTICVNRGDIDLSVATGGDTFSSTGVGLRKTRAGGSQGYI